MSTKYNIVDLEELKQRFTALHNKLHTSGCYSIVHTLDHLHTSRHSIDMMMLSTLGENDIFSKCDPGFREFDRSNNGARIFSSFFEKVDTNRLLSAYKLTEFGCLYAKAVKAKIMLEIGEYLWESSNKTKTVEEFELNVTMWYNDIFDLDGVADACNTLMHFKENFIASKSYKDRAFRVYSGSVMRGVFVDVDDGIDMFLLHIRPYTQYVRSKWLESKNAQVVKAA